MNARVVAAFGLEGLPQWFIPIVDSRLVERIGWTLLASVGQFAAVALLLVLCQRALAKRPAQIRYLTSCAALLAMVALSAATFAAIHLPERPAASTLAQTSISSPSRDEGPSVVPSDRPGAAADQMRPAMLGSAERSTASANLQPADAPPPVGPAQLTWRERIITILEPWLATIVAIWLAGVGLLSARPIAGWWYVLRLRREGTSAVPPAVQGLLEHAARRLGVQRAIRVLQSTLVNVPAVVGCFRPLVLLPVSVVTGLSARELEAILAHELAHIRRHDYLVNLLQMLVETLFFYHPAVWWVSHLIREERENCCDELAVAACGDTTTYASALLAIEHLRGACPAPALSAAGGSLSSRIRRIVGRPEKAPSVRSGGPLAAAVLAAMLVLGLSLAARQSSHENESALSAAEKSRPASFAVDETERPNPADPSKKLLRLNGLQPAPKSIRVDLRLAQKEFLLGESIVVDVEMTNVGTVPVPYEQGAFFPTLRMNDGFRMSAVKVDETGKALGPPVDQWPFPENFGGPVGGFTLKPDECRTTTLFVTRYIRFLEPGRYRLQIENQDRGQQAVHAAGETLLTLKQPSLEEARGVYRAMKRAPRKAYDDNAMKFLRDAADFETMHQSIYLAVLKENAEERDVDALSSLERMETIEANTALVAAVAKALDRDDWQLARACYRHLKSSLPFPNWYDEPLNAYDKGHREKVARSWKLEFGSVLTRLARRLTAEVAAKMRAREAQPADADANDPAFMDLFQRECFPRIIRRRC